LNRRLPESVRKTAPKKTPELCNKPKMPPGTEPDKPRKPPWAGAVTVRRDRLVAGHAAHEAKELLKMREAMAEKGYDLSVVPQDPVQYEDYEEPYVSPNELERLAHEAKAILTKLHDCLEASDKVEDELVVSAGTLISGTDQLVDALAEVMAPRREAIEKMEAEAKKRREALKAEEDKAAAEAAAEEAAAALEDKEAAAAEENEEEQQDGEEEEDEEEEDSEDEYHQVDEDKDDDEEDDDDDDDDAPPPATGGATRKKKRGRPAPSDDEEDEAPAPAPAPGRARKPAAKKSKKPAAAAPMDIEEDLARPAADALTAAEVEKMKVYDLKLALEARGLSTEGLKKVLKARLLAAMDESDEESVPEVPGTTI
jgi:hypothetical protein